MANVLIVAPIYDGKDYCVEEYIENLEKIDYPYFDYMVIDNSKDDWFFEKLKFLIGDKAYRVGRGDNSRDALSITMNFARTKFLEGNYTHMLVLESDLFPDKDVINRLLAHDKPVVGSYYLLGFRKDNKVYEELLKKVAFGLMTKEEFKKRMKGVRPQTACIFIEDLKDNTFIGTRLLSPKESKEWLGTGLRQIHGCGLGCTMIKREIINMFTFWTDIRFNTKHHDVYFYLDLSKAKIPVFVDTNFNIRHEPSDWDFVTDR